MYPVGHVVIGCGAVWAASRLLEQREPLSGTPANDSLSAGLRRIDYRWVALGALLPDLIDKPFTWSGVVGDHTGGHFIGHAILFQIALLLVGLVFARRGDWQLVLVAIGALTHIAADSATHVPRSVFWPFVTLPVSHNPAVVGATNIAGELFGSLIVLWFFYARYRQGHLPRLIRTGAI
jgi:hypothetical protein